MATTIYLIRPETYPVSYLLDDYTAAAAYSLRQLKTGVTSVVRVRRSSDNAEQDFTAEEITDGTLTTWTGANDGFVVTWYNQVGAADLTSTVATEQPKLVSSGTVITKGALPAVQFDGSNDNIRNNAAAFVNTSDVSFFSVSSGVTSSAGVVLSLHNTLNTTLRIFNDTRTTPNRNLFITNTTPTNYAADLSTVRTDTNQRLLSSFIDSSKNMSAFDNGSTGGTSTWSGTVNSNGLMLGKQSGANWLNGYIQEVIIFNSDETSNRTDIESDINTYYSIY